VKLTLQQSPWQIAVIATALLFMLPLITVFSFVFQPAIEIWQHLLDTVLKDYIINSILLIFEVTVILATILALLIVYGKQSL